MRRGTTQERWDDAAQKRVGRLVQETADQRGADCVATQFTRLRSRMTQTATPPRFLARDMP